MDKIKETTGNEHILGKLTRAIQSDKVSHSYIFAGEEGMGKAALAARFSSILQCDEGGTSPCNECRSCKQVLSGNHPDIKWVTHEKVSIGVDDIRSQVTSDIHIMPYSSKYKIYIIDDGHKMTEAAQNALLKTIEEPPTYGVVMILVDNLNSMLNTITSRCVSVHLKPVNAGIIKNYLMAHHEVSEYLAEIAASFSGGNIGKAIQYASSEEFGERREESFKILRDIDRMSLNEIMNSVKMISKDKESIDEYIDIFNLWYRDVLIFKASNSKDNIIFKEEIESIQEQSETRTYGEVNQIIQSFDELKDKLKANVNFDIAIELMLLKIKESCNDKGNWS